MRAKTDKNKKNVLKIWRVFPPGQSPSCTDSNQLATSWSASLELWERLQLQLRDATLGSLVASPVWSESSPEKCEKTTQTTRLLGAITFLSELCFAQNLYSWKVDFSIFPKVYCMTYFDHQNASKIGSKKVRESGFTRGATWRIRSPRGSYCSHAPSGYMTHLQAAWNPAINQTPSPTPARSWLGFPLIFWAFSGRNWGS